MEEKKARTPGSSTVQLITIILGFVALAVGVALGVGGDTYAIIYWLVVGVVIFMLGSLIAYTLELLEKILAALHARAED